MKCIDCGKDAVCLYVGSFRILSFAFCLDCVTERMDSKFRFIGENINVKDIWDKINDRVDKNENQRH